MKTTKKALSILLSSTVLLASPATATNNVIFRYNPKVVTVDAMTIAPMTIPDLYVGESFSVSASASGGVGNMSWSHDGNLPAGMSFSSTGILSGTPSTPGNFGGITFTATDETGTKTSFSGVSIPVYNQLASGNLHDVLTLNAAQSKPLPVNGGKSPISFSVVEGSLPSNMSISGGSLTGSPSVAGVSEATIRATDANGRTASIDANLTVFSLLTASAAFGDAYVGEAYAGKFNAAGGSELYTWTIDSGLPGEFSLNASTGEVTGTPASAGSFPFTGHLTDGYEFTSANAVINAFSMPVVSAKAFPDPYTGTAYTVDEGSAPSASGGKAPLSWSATGLPFGLSINSGSGAITGTPTAGGQSTATITVTDANGKKGFNNFSFQTRTALALAGKTYPDPYVATAYTAVEGAPPSATYGLPPYTFSATGLPAGLSMNSAGLISGTPTSAAATTATVTVRDANNKTQNQTYSFTPRATLVITNNLPTAVKMTEGVDTTMAITGGLGPYSWSATGLPPGLSMASNGRVTGTPSSVGTYNSVITVTDANGKQSASSRSIVSDAGVITATMSGGDGAINLRSMFSAADWSSNTPKVVNLPAGQIRGSTSATNVVTIGGSWGGTLTFNVAGEIRGKYGNGNSGAGGNALYVEYAGASGQKLNLNVTGAIRGGGGGGGMGGTGGNGGGGYVSSTSSEGPRYTAGTYQWGVTWYNGSFISAPNATWNGTAYAAPSGTAGTATSFTSGGYTFTRGAVKQQPGSNLPTQWAYEVSRSGTTTTYTNGGGGGQGGNGGNGVGYNVNAAGGAAGAGGAGGGQNAGAGGQGGTGGTGGSWGTAGNPGNQGATGGGGNNGGGAAGAGGAAGGAAGYSVVGSGNANITGGGTFNGPRG